MTKISPQISSNISPKLPTSFSRRKLITSGLAVTAGAAGLTAASRLARRYGIMPPDNSGIYGAGETLNYAAQRLLANHSLAREFPRSMISTSPFANEIAPPTDAFKSLQAGGFSAWRVAVDGMVARPQLVSLSDIKALPFRSQITEVACEEGWSYIAEWIGTPLSELLNEVGASPRARYVVYYAMEKNAWDSIDIAEALHPQTLLTWGMNDGDLPVRFGGPLRMRLPRQLGYKNMKFVTRLTVTDNLKNIGKGLGAAEPESGYAWYAGI